MVASALGCGPYISCHKRCTKFFKHHEHDVRLDVIHVKIEIADWLVVLLYVLLFLHVGRNNIDIVFNGQNTHNKPPDEVFFNV